MEQPGPGTWEGADRREKAVLEFILNVIDGFPGDLRIVRTVANDLSDALRIR
jgi:hypothetical protein